MALGRSHRCDGRIKAGTLGPMLCERALPRNARGNGRFRMLERHRCRFLLSDSNIRASYRGEMMQKNNISLDPFLQ